MMEKYEIQKLRELPIEKVAKEMGMKVLGWKTKRTLEDMCRDTWNWQKNNPQGYK